MATTNLVYFRKQSKPATPRKSKPNDKKKPEPKETALDWIRNGYQFPGKPAPNPEPPKPDENGVPFPVPPPPKLNPEPKPPVSGGVVKRRKPIETRFYRSLSISEIEEVAASFKKDLQRDANRRVRRHDSAGALAAIEAMEYTDKFLTTLKLKAGSQLGSPREPKKRIRAIYIPEAIKKAPVRVSVTDEDKETQKHAREVAAASQSMGQPKHY